MPLISPPKQKQTSPQIKADAWLGGKFETCKVGFPFKRSQSTLGAHRFGELCWTALHSVESWPKRSDRWLKRFEIHLLICSSKKCGNDACFFCFRYRRIASRNSKWNISSKTSQLSNGRSGGQLTSFTKLLAISGKTMRNFTTQWCAKSLAHVSNVQLL